MTRTRSDGLATYIRPAGPADAEAIARIQQASWEKTYAGLLPTEVIERVAEVWNADAMLRALQQLDDRRVVLVADRAPGRVAGFVTCGPQRGPTPGYGAEIYALYVNDADTRQGLGKALMAAAARTMAARSYGSILVWALDTNKGACRFYERLEGTPLGTRPVTVYGARVREAGYGWRDIGSLGCLSPGAWLG